MAYDIYLEGKKTIKETRVDNIFIVFAAFCFALLLILPFLFF